VEGYVYAFENASGVDFEGCWAYVGTRLDGQPISVLDTVAEFGDCTECYGLPAPLTWGWKENGYQQFTRISPQPPFLVNDNGNTQILSVGNADFDIEINFPYYGVLTSKPYGGSNVFIKLITFPPTVMQLAQWNVTYNGNTTTGFTVTTAGAITDYAQTTFNTSVGAANANVNVYMYFTMEVTATTPTLAYVEVNSNAQIAYTGGTTDATDERFHFVWINNIGPKTITCLGQNTSTYTSNANSGAAISNYAIERAYYVKSLITGIAQNSNLNEILANGNFILYSIII
jgi:hypothetical protein